MTFKDYVGKTVDNWDSNDVQEQIAAYKYAILRDLRKAHHPEHVAALESLLVNVEDIAFWVQLTVLLNIELPD